MERKGRYRLTRRLGQGGMAEVFEGVAESEAGFKRRVAIKRMLPELSADPSCGRMFLDEARIAAHLHHANVVSVLDYGTLDGVPFQVLEFVDGADLEQLLLRAEQRDAQLPIGLALYVATQIAHALEHVHGARDERGEPLGIVHRDVSPSNVLVSWAGHVKLADFGIAVAHDRLERTSAGGIKGKISYMAPEQAMRGLVDGRSDVFALGCLLHRLITGATPLADLGVLAQLAGGAELELAPQLDPEIARVIAKATRCARHERYDARALALALGALVPRYLSEEPTGALQRFLAPLREPRERAAKRGALDALLDLELVLADANEPQGRSFTAHPASLTRHGSEHEHPDGLSLNSPQANAAALGQRTHDASTPRREADSGARAEPLVPGETVRSAVQETAAHSAHANSAFPARAVRRYVLLGAIAAALALAVMATFVADRSDVRAARPPPAPPHAPNPSASAPVAYDRRILPTTSSGVHDGLAQAAASAAPDVQGMHAPNVGAQDAKGAPRSSGRAANERKSRAHLVENAGNTARPTPGEQTSSARGTLVIGGAGANRAEIRVDGQSVGFAPKRVELATGQHEVLLVRPDGSRLGPRLVPITTAHTPSAPARWMVE